MIHRLATIVLVSLFVFGGCWRSPEARKARYLKRADTYFSQERYHDAILEYLNLLRIEPTNVHAIKNVGMAHMELGELGQAYQFLLRAEQLDAGDAAVHLKLAALYLAGRKLGEAHDEANLVLQKQPENLDALILFAGAAPTSEEVADVIGRLEKLRDKFSDQAKYHLGLGTLYLKNRQLDRARAEFEEAVAKEPKSVEAHTVLGDFYFSRGNAAAAEPQYKAAADNAAFGSQAGKCSASLPRGHSSATPTCSWWTICRARSMSTPSDRSGTACSTRTGAPRIGRPSSRYRTAARRCVAPTGSSC